MQSFQSGRADHCTVNTIRHIYCIQATRPHHHIIALSSIALGFNHKYNSLPHHKTHHPINRYILLLNPMNFKKHSPSFLAITFTQASRDPIKNSSRSIVIYCIFERLSQSVQLYNIVWDNSFFLKVLSQKPVFVLDRVMGSIYKC